MNQEEPWEVAVGCSILATIILAPIGLLAWVVIRFIIKFW